MKLKLTEEQQQEYNINVLLQFIEAVEEYDNLVNEMNTRIDNVNNDNVMGEDDLRQKLFWFKDDLYLAKQDLEDGKEDKEEDNIQ